MRCVICADAGNCWSCGGRAAPTEAEIIEAVKACLRWCLPLPDNAVEVACSTVEHNWRRFVKKD